MGLFISDVLLNSNVTPARILQEFVQQVLTFFLLFGCRVDLFRERLRNARLYVLFSGLLYGSDRLVARFGNKKYTADSQQDK